MKQLIILIIIVVAVVGFSLVIHSKQKGKWVCEDNIWVAQGNPKDPKPGLYCK